MFRPDHSSDRPVRHLEWRIRLFGAAAIVAGFGIYFNRRWLVWVAMGVLVVGLMLRLVPEGEEGEDGVEGAE